MKPSKMPVLVMKLNKNVDMNNANKFLKWCEDKEKRDYHHECMGETIQSFDLVKGKIRYAKKSNAMRRYKDAHTHKKFKS